MAGNRVYNPLIHAVTLGEFRADNGVRSFYLVVDGFAQVVQQAAHLGDGNVRAQFARDHPSQVRRLDAVCVLVLAVAGAELQAAQQLDNLRMQTRYTRFVSGCFAFFADNLVNFLFGVLDQLFDACRVNAPVEDQFAQRTLGDFAPHRVEAGDRDGFRRIVYHHVDARGLLKGANVAPVAPDDATFHLV